MTTIGDGTPTPRTRAAPRRFFAEPLREFVSAADASHPVHVLQAGCLAPLRELALGELADSGFEFSVSLVDDDDPRAREILGQTADAYDDVITGDLRTVPLPPRAFDIVYCGGLLERVAHVELVLDRLTSALRPGGLLLLRFGDRDSAWAVLNRLLPHAARRAIWQRLRPGVPGPFPAVYEAAASQHGIASYALLHGLVIDQQAAEETLPDGDGLSSTVRLTCAAIAKLSGGRFSNRRDELLYVIRKPQDRFARVV